MRKILQFVSVLMRKSESTTFLLRFFDDISLKTDLLINTLSLVKSAFDNFYS
jgi:hypothetical protein